MSFYPAWLLRRQRFLLEQLLAVDPCLHDWYLGALFVLNDESNPDRIALAAHGLREVSDRLMRLAGVEKQNSLGNEVTGLHGKWVKVKSDAASCAGSCATHVSVQLRGFLDELDKVLDNHVRFLPTRKTQILTAVEKFDVNDRIATGGAAKSTQDLWFRLHTFFNNCGHHGKTDLSELKVNLGEFESLLIDLRLPSPSGDLSMIDEILAEAEADA